MAGSAAAMHVVMLGLFNSLVTSNRCKFFFGRKGAGLLSLFLFDFYSRCCRFCPTGTLGGGLTSSVGGGAATSGWAVGSGAAGWASDSGVVSRAVSGIAAAVAAADGCGVSVAALVAGALGDDTCSACARVCSACVGPGETNCMASF